MKDELVKHKQEHHTHYYHNCSLCSYAATNRNDLNIHEHEWHNKNGRNHYRTSDNPYRCDDCDYETWIRIDLVQHNENHMVTCMSVTNVTTELLNKMKLYTTNIMPILQSTSVNFVVMLLFTCGT